MSSVSGTLVNSAGLVAAAETRLGRPLRRGEHAVNLAAIDRTLETGKERLHRVIQAELRATLRELLRTGAYPYLAETAPMRAALRDLHAAGRREAFSEMARLSVTPRDARRAFAVDEPAALVHTRQLLATLLLRISLRAHREATAAYVAGDLSEVGAGAALRALERRVPGALDAASRLVSPAFFSGIGDVFSANRELFTAGWSYSAVLDAATCDECAARDGEEYVTWEDAMAVLPDGGPNLACYGETRCRCRVVPN